MEKVKHEKGIIAFLTVLTILLTGAVKVSADSTQAEIYRLYNKNTGEHFYTSSAFERDSVNKSGWSYEGVGWIAPKNHQRQFIEFSIQMPKVEIITTPKVIMKLTNL